MRKLSANYIFDGQQLIPNAVLIIDEKGVVKELLKFSEGIENVEHFNGILTPGFINTHCHLELSHTKGLVTEGKGLTQFIKELQTKREANHDKIQQAIIEADNEMQSNGIVAVGDISNGTDSFAVKTKSKIKYHTFIELYGFLEEVAETSFNNGIKIAEQLKKLNLSCSLVPHSPYATSEKLISLIMKHASPNDILAMHNQETMDENLLFTEGKGSFIYLMQWFGIDTSFWKPTKKSSLASITPLLPKLNKILLVHNTFTVQKDIDEIMKQIKYVYWAFCPNANAYIENVFPNISLFLKNNQKCTIGTDSLASNWSLSVLDELKSIAKNLPETALETLLQMATINGAEALGLDKMLGSFEQAKKPGVNLIYNIDNLKINPSTDARVVV